MSEPDIAGIQARMAQARADRSMSLEEVAQASGLTKSHVWELEKGRSRNPTIRAVWGISRALAVSPAWLLGLAVDQSPIDPLALEIAALIDRRVRATVEANHD